LPTPRPRRRRIDPAWDEFDREAILRAYAANRIIRTGQGPRRRLERDPHRLLDALQRWRDGVFRRPVPESWGEFAARVAATRAALADADGDPRSSVPAARLALRPAALDLDDAHDQLNLLRTPASATSTAA
jgi:hypothetical protein